MSARILDFNGLGPFGSVWARRAAVNSTRCCLIIRVRSLVLDEADLVGLLSEASPADHKIVLSDEALLVGADSACAGVLAVLAGV